MNEKYVLFPCSVLHVMQGTNTKNFLNSICGTDYRKSDINGNSTSLSLITQKSQSLIKPLLE